MRYQPDKRYSSAALGVSTYTIVITAVFSFVLLIAGINMAYAHPKVIKVKLNCAAENRVNVNNCWCSAQKIGTVKFTRAFGIVCTCKRKHSFPPYMHSYIRHHEFDAYPHKTKHRHSPYVRSYIKYRGLDAYSHKPDKSDYCDIITGSRVCACKIKGKS